jgi:hypothetical protein
MVDDVLDSIKPMPTVSQTSRSEGKCIPSVESSSLFQRCTEPDTE